MADTAIQTLTALRTRLLANSNITSVVNNKVFYTIPEHTSFPYVLLSIQSKDWDTKSSNGSQHTVRIQCFSDTEDQRQALTLRSHVYDSLHRQESNISLNGLVNCISRHRDCFKESNGKIWQSVIEFEVIVDL